MKKFFIALVMCFFAIAANALNEWTPITIDGDELKGTTSYVVYNYDTGEGCLGFYDSTNILVIMSDRGIFDYDIYDYVKGVVIGLYDAKGKLIERVETPTDRTFRVSSHGKAAFCTRNDVNSRVVEFIKNNKGYVRIVADKYSGSDFDVKVPCMK